MSASKLIALRELEAMYREQGYDHVPVMCDVVACENECSYFFEEPSYFGGAFYLCLDHIDDFVVDEDESIVSNSVGELVDLGKYCCDCDSETGSCCAVCDA